MFLFRRGCKKFGVLPSEDNHFFSVGIKQYLTAMHCDTRCSISTAQWGKGKVDKKEGERKKQSGKTGSRIE